MKAIYKSLLISSLCVLSTQAMEKTEQISSYSISRKRMFSVHREELLTITHIHQGKQSKRKRVNERKAPTVPVLVPQETEENLPVVPLETILQSNTETLSSRTVELEEEKETIQGFSQAANLQQVGDQGSHTAQFELGVMYMEGRGVIQDYAQAVKYFIMAILQGNTAAHVSLGDLYLKGKGVKQDYTQALMHFTAAAQRGDKEARFILGCMYQEYQEVAQDYTEAVKNSIMAILQGNTAAHVSLGNLYLKGKGVAQDYNQALMHFTAAAERGEVMGLLNLEDMYFADYDASQDDTQALSPLSKYPLSMGRE